ncbi:MAG: prephenate dehydrogenase [Rhodoluna sp.]
MTVRTTGQVHIIGAGLLGTSIGLTLRKLGVDVSLEDLSNASTKLAVDFGAGRLLEGKDEVQLVVVCVPPDSAAEKITEALARFPQATVTDVASVKTGILSQVRASTEESFRYVGSHPMAGREKGGTLSGRPDLFVGRPWVIIEDDATETDCVDKVERLSLDLGASPIRMSAEDHDKAVALVSHAPQIVSSLLAGRLNEASEGHLSLSGQGLRDTTRIAGSDPALWLQILSANASQVVPILQQIHVELEDLIAALSSPDATGSLTSIAKMLSSGNEGFSRIPGKHGGKNKEYSQIIVMIDDKPGELARLLTEIGEAGVNLEDLNLDHASGALIGLVEISVLPENEQRLIELLHKNNWKLAG